MRCFGDVFEKTSTSMFLTMFFKTQNIVPTMHLTMLIAHPYVVQPLWEVGGLPKRLHRANSSALQMLWKVEFDIPITWPLVLDSVCHIFNLFNPINRFNWILLITPQCWESSTEEYWLKIINCKSPGWKLSTAKILTINHQ